MTKATKLPTQPRPSMTPAHRSLTAVTALAVFAAVAIAAVRPAPTKFTDTTLPNGLRVIIAEDHAAPVFSIAVNYNVGSRNERKGRTGFAHLFEHMMFKGSENVGRNNHHSWRSLTAGGLKGRRNRRRRST